MNEENIELLSNAIQDLRYLNQNIVEIQDRLRLILLLEKQNKEDDKSLEIKSVKQQSTRTYHRI